MGYRKKTTIKTLGGHKDEVISVAFEQQIRKKQKDIDEPERGEFMLKRPKEPGEEKEVEVIMPEQELGGPKKKITFPGIFN